MAKLEQLLDVLHESITLSSAEDIKNACALIIEAQWLDAAERDVLRALYREGPLWDGDISSKKGRDLLLSKGYVEKIVVREEEGYNACTYDGARVYRLIEAGA